MSECCMNHSCNSCAVYACMCCCLNRCINTQFSSLSMVYVIGINLRNIMIVVGFVFWDCLFRRSMIILDMMFYSNSSQSCNCQMIMINMVHFDALWLLVCSLGSINQSKHRGKTQGFEIVSNCCQHSAFQTNVLIDGCWIKLEDIRYMSSMVHVLKTTRVHKQISSIRKK